MEEATISKGRSERGGMRGGMRGPPRSRSPHGGGFHGGFRGRDYGGSSRGSYSRGPPRDGGRMSPRPYRDGPPMREYRRPLSPPRDRNMPMRDSRGPPQRNGMSRDRSENISNIINNKCTSTELNIYILFRWWCFL